MLSPQSWNHLTGSLKGQSGRFNHDCGGGNTLLVTASDDGSYRAWCFRCSEGGFIPAPEMSTEQTLALIRRRQRHDSAAISTPTLPAPLLLDPNTWPPAARAWLYKAGIGDKEIGSLGIGYHEGMDRVVIPIKAQGKLVYWQARAYQPARIPKYLGPVEKLPGLIARFGEGPTVTLVEDLLSAIKVGGVGEAWAMLGTSLRDAHLSEILKTRKDVNVWTDPDKAGQSAARKIMSTLRAYGITCRRIESTTDPKLIPRAEMREVLNGAYCAGPPGTTAANANGDGRKAP